MLAGSVAVAVAVATAAAVSYAAAGGSVPPIGTEAIGPGYGWSCIVRYEWVCMPHGPDAADRRNPER